MSKFLIGFQLFFLLFLASSMNAQIDTAIPSWFVEEMETQIGVWHADNSAYKSDNEPMESYAIEWRWNETKSGLKGKLYGFVNGNKTPVFWDFMMYWDFKQQAGVLFQIGINGTTGYGHFSYNEDRSESKIDQEFSMPNGKTYHEGHITKIMNEAEHIGSSFDISEANEWAKKRTYIWKRQSKN